MFAPLNRLMAVLALCNLLVHSAQAELVNDPPVEADKEDVEHQAATQQKTESKEITIYILGEYKAVAAALLDAVDEGTPVTGIADFDSLSATYGLLGIYRKGSRSSGFYGHRFRLTFPPAADVAVIGGAYWNLPYVRSVEPKPPGRVPDKRISQAASADSLADIRIGKKLAAGVGGGLVGVLAGGLIGSIYGSSERQSTEGDPHPLEGIVLVLSGMWGGYIVGTAAGVSGVDPQDDFSTTLGGSVLMGVGVPYAIDFISVKTGWESGILMGVSAILGPMVGAMIASERGRKPPQDRRVSFGLASTLYGGLSAVTTLRF